MSRKALFHLLMLGLAFAGSAGQVRVQADARRFVFAVYGDSRDGHDFHREIVAQMLSPKPAFVLGTGDYVDRGDNEAAWRVFANITETLRQSIPFYPAKGNHDLEREGKGLYEKYLNMKTNTGQLRYYSFDYAGCHFIVLDTNSSLSPDQPQYQWLLKDLKSSEDGFRHRFAVFHRPLFTLVRRRSEGTDRLRQQLQPLLSSAKLCAVFAGHDHHFYMTKRDRVTYITTGGGGAPLYEMDTTLAQPGDKWGKCYHFLRVKVSPDQAQAEVRDRRGKILERFLICSHR